MEMKNVQFNRKSLFLNQKSYMRFIYSNIMNRFGDSIDTIVMAWMVFNISNDAAISALSYAINLIPTIFFQPLFGPLVEKLNKKLVMIWVYVFRAIFVLIYIIGFTNKWLNVPIILVITFVISTVEAFGEPVNTSFVVRILDKEYFEVGIGLNKTCSSTSSFIGTAFAGVLLGGFGIVTALIVDFTTYILAAIIVLSIPYTEGSNDESKKSSYFKLLNDGFHYLLKSKMLISLCLLAAFINSIFTPYNSLLVPYISEHLSGDMKITSITSIAMTLGMIVGSIALSYFNKKMKKMTIFSLSALSSILLYSTLAIVTFFNIYLYVKVTFIAISIFLLGLSLGIGSGTLSIIFINQIDQEYMARSSAILGAFSLMIIPVISTILSMIVHNITIVEIFISFSLLSLIAYFVLLKKRDFFETYGL